ncbi:MAG: DNA repair exonuclease [Syntrophobacterales bacterium]|nr:DNA repair exonuclease [Syntrophobacterales bacterium]
MSIRILHTADLHLGMKFGGRYPPQVQERLIRSRWETLQTLVNTANEHDTDLMVIAGDLFHHLRVPQREVKAAAQALSGFAGRVVLVLPGNHDFFQEGGCPLWDHFREAADDKLLFLSEPKPYSLLDYDLPLIIYPGPCTAKHSPQSAVGWIDPEVRDKEVWHLGVAHGSLAGVSPDFDGQYYPMTQADLHRAGLDLWLLGHTHLRVPDVDQGHKARVLFAATPEPDGFDCSHEGHAWLIDLEEDRSLSYRSLKTGRCRFSVLEAELSSEDDLDALRRRFQKDFRPERDLVKLVLKGSLPVEVFAQLGDFLEELQQMVLYLEPEVSGLFRRLTVADVDQAFTQGSFPHRLLKRLIQEGGDPRILQLAYDLIQEVKS